MRRALILLAALLAASLVGVAPSRAQFTTCDHAYVSSFDVPAHGEMEAWSAGTIECVEYFRISFTTPHGVRWIRGVGDINVDALLAPGAIDAVERGARLSAQRFEALGDYEIDNVTILMTFSRARPMSVDLEGATAAWTLGDARECHVTLFLLNDYSVDVEIPHMTAHELFHCVQDKSLTPGQFATAYSGGAWWVEGTAEVFAAAVTGNHNVRWNRAIQFDQAVREGTPIHLMDYEAAVLFYWLHERDGLDAIMRFIRAMPEDGGERAQRAAIRRLINDADMLDFVQAYDDRTINYPNDGPAPFGPRPEGETLSIGASGTQRLTLEPLVITLGWAEYACGLWGNRLNEVNAEARDADSREWGDWPAETDGRGGGGARYRTAAVHTGDETAHLNLRVERREACEACMSASVIDRCVVGVWRQTGGGPVEFLRRRGVPITHANMGELILRMNDDGSFTTDPVAVDVGVEYEMPHGRTLRGDGAGETHGARGHWSAEEGRLNGCFDSGGGATGSTRFQAGTQSRTVPWGGGDMSGRSGATRYTCSATTFTTSSPTEHGPMEYTFTRMSPPPED